jgi:hypothetical protein
LVNASLQDPKQIAIASYALKAATATNSVLVGSTALH